MFLTDKIRKSLGTPFSCAADKIHTADLAPFTERKRNPNKGITIQRLRRAKTESGTLVAPGSDRIPLLPSGPDGVLKLPPHETRLADNAAERYLEWNSN